MQNRRRKKIEKRRRERSFVAAADVIDDRQHQSEIWGVSGKRIYSEIVRVLFTRRRITALTAHNDSGAKWKVRRRQQQQFEIATSCI